MALSPELTLFTRVADADLAQAALLIAEPEYPGLDIPRYLAALDAIGRTVRERLGAAPALEAIARLLHGELGFRGNAEDYYDPRNSYLNEVLDRRTGIPITLAVVLIEVARRAGVPADGVSFPGHFLVRSGEVIVDPYEGRRVDAAGLRALLARATGEERDPDPRLLEPCEKRDIVQRMLNNLRAIFTRQGDERRLAHVVAHMEALAIGASPRVLN